MDISPPPTGHYKDVAEAIRDGDVVPFIGAGVNLCGYETLKWDPHKPCRLPLGSELADYLAKKSEYPLRDFEAMCTCHTEENKHNFKEVPEDLLRISQYVVIKKDRRYLDRRLAELFKHKFGYTPVHSFLAELPKKLQAIDCDSPHLLVVTTNYDDTIERAFEDAGERFDVVYYIAGGPDIGKFLHKTHDGKVHLIKEPKRYCALSLTEGSIIFKIHGTVHRDLKKKEELTDSFMITEDDYINYLAQVDLDQIPIQLRAKMRLSNFLFLGYSLRDWNLRALLRSILKERYGTVRSWAIQRKKTDAVEKQFWASGDRQVQFYGEDLNVYIAKLCKHLKI